MKPGDEVRCRGINQDSKLVWMSFPYLLVEIKETPTGQKCIVSQSGGENHRIVAIKDVEPFRKAETS